jgi:hypothetical protein
LTGLALEMDQETKWLVERTEELIAASKKGIEDYRAWIVRSEKEIKRLKAVIEKARTQFKKRK